jgi:hypothetical protein
MQKMPAAIQNTVTGRDRYTGCSTMKKVWIVYMDGTQQQQPQHK